MYTQASHVGPGYWDLVDVVEDIQTLMKIHSVDFSPEGTRLAVGEGNGVARIFDLTSGTMLHEVTPVIEDWLSHRLTFNQDGTRLVTGSVDGKVMVWDPVTGPDCRPTNDRTLCRNQC